jgi:hypothetical protein
MVSPRKGMHVNVNQSGHRHTAFYINKVRGITQHDLDLRIQVNNKELTILDSGCLDPRLILIDCVDLAICVDGICNSCRLLPLRQFWTIMINIFFMLFAQVNAPPCCQSARLEAYFQLCRVMVGPQLPKLMTYLERWNPADYHQKITNSSRRRNLGRTVTRHSSV